MGRRKGVLTLHFFCGLSCGLFRERFRPQMEKPLRGAFPERLGGISRASVRLVFLFLGGFLFGCHEVFPPFERFCSPKVLDRAP
jgi:hypothetical protein